FCKRKNTGFNGDLRASSSARTIGQIEVFELGFCSRRFKFSAKLIGQFFLRVDRFDNGTTAIFKLAKIDKARLKFAKLRIIKSAGYLFTIARNKRNGRPLIKQGDGSAHLGDICVNFTSNNGGNSRDVRHIEKGSSLHL